MQAHRNGFFYVLERRPARLLAANKFVKVNWADGVDLETGRPVWSAETKAVFEKGAGHKVRVWPALVGGKNWAPMSYSPQTGLAYVNRPTSAGTTRRNRWRSWPSSSRASRPTSA